jgi:hypothetical protein
MNDPDNFLSRWSRRKMKARAQPGKDGAIEDASSTPGEQQRAGSVSSAGSPPAAATNTHSVPEFDVSSLPSIESIGAHTDISVFMQKGVPAALRHAALRRAWSADPNIRDFMGPTENYWDAAGPEGIPGFGDLDPGLDVRRMVAELFGEGEPKRAEAETSAKVDPSVPAAEISEPQKGRQREPSQRIENVAPQQHGSEAADASRVVRRHGGAMPE